MAFAPSKFELWFLDDSNCPSGDGAGTYLTEYRNGLQWKRWNRRISGVAGDGATFTDTDGVNSASGSSALYLRGKFGRSNINASTLSRDYIIDNNDSIIVGSHPLWTYTWIAIQNNGVSGEDAFRVHLQCGRGYGTSPAASMDWKYLENAENYGSFRWMGLIDNAVLNSFVTNGATSFFASNTTSPLWKYFPHVAAVQQVQQTQAGENTKYNIWNALAETELVSGNSSRLLGAAFPSISQFTSEQERVYLGYNNRAMQDLSILKKQSDSNSIGYTNYPTGTAFYYYMENPYKPYQVNRWIDQSNYNASPKPPYHCFDIPAGKTALGILVKTKEQSQLQFGDGPDYMNSVQNYNWKVSEIAVNYDYLVI